jgi:hypothetical protein
MDDCLAQVAIDFEVETGWFGIPNSNGMKENENAI